MRSGLCNFISEDVFELRSCSMKTPDPVCPSGSSQSGDVPTPPPFPREDGLHVVLPLKGAPQGLTRSVCSVITIVEQDRPHGTDCLRVPIGLWEHLDRQH